MSILMEIQSSLKALSKSQSIYENSGYRAASSIIEDHGLEVVQNLIDENLNKYLIGGEKIKSKIMEGKISDCGKDQFIVKRGYVTEFYEYDSMTSVFIRNYNIFSGKAEWIAVYIDENPQTPWWEKPERIEES